MTLSTDEQAAQAGGFTMPEGTSLLRQGDNAIRDNAVAAYRQRHRRGTLASGSNLDTLDEGAYAIVSYAAAASMTASAGKLPDLAAGTLTVARQNANVVMTWQTSGGTRSLWACERDGGTWKPWHRLDPDPRDAAWKSVQVAQGTDLDTLRTPGVYNLWSDAQAATMLNAPPPKRGGIIIVTAWGSATVQTYYSATEAWYRMNGGGGFFPWRQLYPQTPPATATAGGSGWKRVPLAVTLGAPDADAPTAGTWRVPIRWDAPIARWRVHVANRQPKTGTARGAVTLDGVWVGGHAGSGKWDGTPAQVAGTVTLPADGSEYVSPWRDDPISGRDSLLAFSYTGAASAPWALCGGSWTAAGQVAPDAGASLTRSATTPLSWWIEAETYATTPVVAVLGDSLSCGVGATTPVYDSVLSQWCRGHKTLPVHYAASGDHMLGMSDASAWKWTRWDGLARPDALLWAIGANDLQSANLATMQARLAAVLPIAQLKVNGPIFLAEITPRNGETGTWEDTRRAYNAWLRDSRPGDARAVFGFPAAISDDDETIRASANADGIHLTTTGYAAEAAAITQPLTAPAPAYA